MNGIYLYFVKKYFSSWPLWDFKEIREVKDILLMHVHSTSKFIGGAKDEISSIKNMCKVRSDVLQAKVEVVTNSTISINQSTECTDRLANLK